MADISEFLKSSKGRVLSSRFVSRVKSAIQPIAQALEVEIVSNKRTAEELKSELAELRRRKAAMESDREVAERKFSLAWSNAVDGYERGMKEAKSSVIAAVSNKINRIPMSEVTTLSKELPTNLAKSIEDQLRPAALRFEEAAKEACDFLQTNYPQVPYERADSVVLRVREDQTAVTGAVGGFAAATVGFGFASAGAAAAATIATANAAAAAAASATVTAPSILTALLPVLGLDFLAPLATGTATLATPVALTTTPLWVALAGPLGWTLAGVGVLAVPLSWRLSKLKMKDKLLDACEDQVDKVFRQLQTERLQSLRSMGKSILEEVRLRLDRQVIQIETVLANACERRPSESERLQLEVAHEKMRSLLSRYPS